MHSIHIAQICSNEESAHSRAGANIFNIAYQRKVKTKAPNTRYVIKIIIISATDNQVPSRIEVVVNL